MADPPPPPRYYSRRRSTAATPLSQWIPRVRLQIEWPQRPAVADETASQQQQDPSYALSEDDRSYYAVIDVEAIVMGRIDVVLQAAIVLVDAFGREVLGEKHMVYQPMSAQQLAAAYGLDRTIVDRGIRGYELITQDSYLHADATKYERWGAVRKRIQQICQRNAIAVYAKGIELEYRVFYGELPFYDLAWYGCPKYPLPVHDPLLECRYFAQHIPDLISRPVYLF